MAYYQTQITKVGSGYAVDTFGKRLKFIGNYPCQAGDFVWTDGNVIFGNISVKPQPVIVNKVDSGIPAIFYVDDEQWRGYFNKVGIFHKLNMRVNDSFVNNSNKFFGVPNNGDIFDADISIDGNLWTLRTERNGVANYLDGEILPIHIYLNESLFKSTNLDANNSIAVDVQRIFECSQADVRYRSDAPTRFIYNNFLTQLLLGKIDSQGKYQLILGSYTSADFVYPDSDTTYVPSFDPKIKFVPDENDFVFDFQGTCSPSEDFSWIKSKYNAGNNYLDSDIPESLHQNYVELRNFRRDHDKYLLPAVIELFNAALTQPISSFELEAYHLNEGITVPEYIPDVQVENFFAVDASNSVTRLFHHDTVKYKISMNQGRINRAGGYTATLAYQDPNKPLSFNINPTVPKGSFTSQEAYRPIATVVIIKDFENTGYYPELQDKKGVIYHYTSAKTPVMIDGAVLTYKVYPLEVAGPYQGIVYNFFATWISAPFQGVYSTVDSTLHISFNATDLFNNTLEFNNWIVNSDEFFYTYIDYRLNPYVNIKVSDGFDIPYGIYRGDNWQIRSLFAIDSDYYYETNIPMGGRWHPIENITMTQLKNGNYLVGIHGDKLFKVDSLDEQANFVVIGDNLKNFRLNELKQISKARR